MLKIFVPIGSEWNSKHEMLYLLQSMNSVQKIQRFEKSLPLGFIISIVFLEFKYLNLLSFCVIHPLIKKINHSGELASQLMLDDISP